MISMNLRILLIVMSILIFLIVLRLIRKGNLPVKYSLLWIIASLVLFLVGLIPEKIGKLTKLIGFEATSNFVIGVLLVMLLAISLTLTLIMSKQKKSIILLVQEISMLKIGMKHGQNDRNTLQYGEKYAEGEK